MEMQQKNKKYIYKNEETDLVNLHDCCIKSIRFNKFATYFYIDWHEGYGSFIIKCLYPELIEYNFSSRDEKITKYYQNYVINHLEITGFSYLKEKDGYIIQFDFDNYPIGYIRLCCSEFIFECPNLPTSSGGNDHRIPWDPLKVTDPFD